MLCRITGKICTAWSETAGCGLVRCKFVEDKGGDEGMTDRRKDCPMRHENGNCTVAGGFCTAVNDPICEALHNAFNCGYRSALRQQEHPNAPLTGWVSVKERLPEADVAVLARCFYNESWRTLVCHTSKRNAGEWYTNVTGQWVQVTNWMPLPEPPEEGTV